MEFEDAEIEDLKKKDKENEDKIKELEDKLLYQEVYNRRENCDLDFSLKSVNLDTEGRSIIMEAEVQGSLFLFVNIYAPTRFKTNAVFK